MPFKTRIYLASSWRNPYHEAVLAALREAGHEVFDYRAEGKWWEKDGEAQPNHHAGWTTFDGHNAFVRDVEALEHADVVVMLLPSGISSHMELAFSAGLGDLPDGQVRIVLYPRDAHGQCEGELMLRWAHGWVPTVGELLTVLASPHPWMGLRPWDEWPAQHQVPPPVEDPWRARAEYAGLLWMQNLGREAYDGEDPEVFWARVDKSIAEINPVSMEYLGLPYEPAEPLGKTLAEDPAACPTCGGQEVHELGCDDHSIDLIVDRAKARFWANHGLDLPSEDEVTYVRGEDGVVTVEREGET